MINGPILILGAALLILGATILMALLVFLGWRERKLLLQTQAEVAIIREELQQHKLLLTQKQTLGFFANGNHTNGHYTNGNHTDGHYANGAYANGNHANGHDQDDVDMNSAQSQVTVYTPLEVQGSIIVSAPPGQCAQQPVPTHS